MTATTFNPKRLMAGLALIMIALMLYLPLNTLAGISGLEDEGFIYEWNGNGKDSLNCGLAGQGGRPDDGSGWIHWVFTSKGSSTGATLTLGGSGSGNYLPGEPYEAEVWHFYTPYFDPETLTAYITLEGGDKGPGTGLVISDFCPGESSVQPLLVVEKVLLGVNDEEIQDSDESFSFLISGGIFGEGEEFSFSVNGHKLFDKDAGLEFDVEYYIEEVEHNDFDLISISQSSVTLTEEINEIYVTIVNKYKENDDIPEGIIIIEKEVKGYYGDDEVLPVSKSFFFNVYNHDTDELIIENLELEVTDGKGSVTIDELDALGVYRVEEIIGGGYSVVLDPEDGIVDLGAAENNSVTVIVTNSPRPQLIIEKNLLDADGITIEEDETEFTVIIDGGIFDSEEITFSVDEPAEIGFEDGLEFEVLYTITEVEHDDFELVSIVPGNEITLTDDLHQITATIVNQVKDETPPPQSPPISPPPVIFITPPEEPFVEPEEEVEEDPVVEISIEAEDPEVEPEEEISLVMEPEEPATEPETEVLVLEPEAPLATPQTDGSSLPYLASGLALIGVGLLIKSRKTA